MVIPSFFYPLPPRMPPVVGQHTGQLLEQLDESLRTRAPAIAASLRPGLSDEAIKALETEGAFQLTDDLRAFYKWHDGTSQDGPRELIPGHRFLSLEETIRQRAAMRQGVRKAPWPERSAHAIFAGHRDPWITIMDDVAGDGYFYDPGRKSLEGSFFYHFAEGGTYLYFPKFRNFVAAVLDCYNSGAYVPARDGKSWERDFEKASTVERKYAASNP